MPNIDRHAPGSFCWIELGTTDQHAAKQFYGQLLGWQPNDSPMGPDEVYTIFQVGGRAAAAAYTLRPDQKAHGVPPHWLLYIAVENADAAAARAKELGATILGGPFDASEFGRMAIIQDPTGAVFAVWQARTHPGIGIAGEEGTLCWAELSTSDPSGAKPFYSRLFGWELSPGENDPSGYLHIKNGGEFIGGVATVEQRNANAPPHWLAYFLVADCDGKAAMAKGMGANLYVPPMSIENVGRMSVIADPQGPVFALFTPERSTEPAA